MRLGFPRIGEESHRWLRADEDHVFEPGKYLKGRVDHVRNAVHRHSAATARHAWYMRWSTQLRTGGVCNSVGSDEARLTQGLPVEE